MKSTLFALFASSAVALQINLGSIDADTIDGTTYIENLAWIDGQDPCSTAQDLSQYPVNPCGTEFCLGGTCGYTVNGCGDGLWIDLNGGFWGNCFSNDAGGWFEPCGEGFYFGDISQTWSCTN